MIRRLFPVLALLVGVLAGCSCRSVHPYRGDVLAGVSFVDGEGVVFDRRGAVRGPTVVLLHGWRCDRHLWRWTAEELARDHHVVCIDLPGHGDSEPAPRARDVAGLASAVVGVLEGLRYADRFVLVGHSLGGPVALEVAARMPGRIAGVVGIDTLHDVEARTPPEEWEKVFAAFEADPEKALRGFLPGMLAPGTDPAIGEWLVEHAMRADRGTAEALMRAFPSVDQAALLSRAGVPVRCLNADPKASPFGRPTAVETQRKYADFDVVLLEGVGHYPMVERPVTFAARLREVLAGLK